MTTLDSKITVIENHNMWAKRLKLCLALNRFSTDDTITPSVAQVFAAFKIANSNGNSDAEVPTQSWENLMEYYQQEPDDNGHSRMVIVTDVEEMEEKVSKSAKFTKANDIAIDMVTDRCLRFFYFKASRASLFGLPYVQLRCDVAERIQQYIQLFS